MGRRGKPRAIGRKGAQRRVRPLHQVRRSPIVKSVHWHNVLYVAMGECDRKPLIKLKAHLRVCLFLCKLIYNVYFIDYKTFLKGIFLIILGMCDILIICLSGLE